MCLSEQSEIELQSGSGGVGGTALRLAGGESAGACLAVGVAGRQQSNAKVGLLGPGCLSSIMHVGSQVLVSRCVLSGCYGTLL